jgi:hypothetical protein
VWQCFVGEWKVNTTYVVVSSPFTSYGVDPKVQVGLKMTSTSGGGVTLTEISIHDLLQWRGEAPLAGTIVEIPNPATDWYWVGLGASGFILSAFPTAGQSVNVKGLAVPPVFALDADYIQLQEAEIDAVIEYAAHVALFAEGGDEFSASSVALQKMVTLASIRNSRLASLSPYKKYLGKDASMQEKSLENKEGNPIR